MSNNIYKVISEDHLFEIRESNKQRLTITVFTHKFVDPTCEMKKCIIDLSQKYKDTLFLYVDLGDYQGTGKINLNSVPKTIFTFNDDVFGVVHDNNIPEFYRVFNMLQPKMKTLNNLQNYKMQLISEAQKSSQKQPPQNPQNPQTQDDKLTNLVEKLKQTKQLKELSEKNANN